MDKLKQLVAAKRKAAEEEFGGKKFVKRADIEELRLKRLREEEEQERVEKVFKRQAQEAAGEGRLVGRATDVARAESKAAAAAAGAAAPPARPAPGSLSREEVVRRLRRLGEPTTLFGETDEQRFERMLYAEENVQVEDEALGGQQENFHLRFQREQRQRAAGKGGGKEGGGAGAAASAKAAAAAAAAAAAPGGKPDGGAAGGAAAAGQEGLQDEDEEEGVEGAGALRVLTPEELEGQQLEAQFKAAAEVMAEKQMKVEDRIAKWLKRWMTDWEEDLEARPEEVKNTATGRQADMRFRETQQYLKPLFARLKHRGLDTEMLAGLKIIVDSMKERNYLHAYKLYMGLAVGNSPWPIGVTQVGLHERSAREKISFKGSSGTAHIMNDEATRKYIQAIKRLMTFCQRRYPTLPSRCVDFDGGRDVGRGAYGGGGDKLALLTAIAKGDTTTPAPAPSVHGRTGAVKIPGKWNHMIRDAMREVDRQSDSDDEQEAGAGAEARAAGGGAAAAAGQQQQAAAGRTG